MQKPTIYTFALCTLFAFSASASTITYRPTNPLFDPSANVVNGSTFQNLATTSKKNEVAATGGSSILNQSTASAVRSLILSQVASRLQTQILCSGQQSCANSGSYSLGSGSNISFVRDTVAGTVEITFTDPDTGTTTIVVPDI